MNFDTNNIVTIISCLISGFFGYTISYSGLKNPQKQKVLNDAFYKVYLPLFRKMESNLYKSISYQEALEYVLFFNMLKSNYYELINSNLINEFQIFENQLSANKSCPYEDYETVCQRVDKLFELHRRKLFLPRRNFFYKSNNHQFPKSFLNNCKYLLEKLLELIPLILFLLLTLCITNFLQITIDWIISIFSK